MVGNLQNTYLHHAQPSSLLQEHVQNKNGVLLTTTVIVSPLKKHFNSYTKAKPKSLFKNYPEKKRMAEVWHNKEQL